MSNDHETRAAEFLREIADAAKGHEWAYTKDSLAYRSIVIGSAICGVLSLIFGTANGNAVVASVFGAITTIASVLTQTLHCVKAQGWQDRMQTELDGIRIQFVYEHNSDPTPEALAGLAKQYRELKSKMSKEWERVISSQSGGLNNA